VSNKPETIKIDEVEYVRKDSVVQYTSRKEGPWEIGKRYVIRTVTMINHGRLVEVTPTDFVLVNAAWIADTARWADFLTGKVKPNEVEPYPWDRVVTVNRGAYVDMVQLEDDFKVQK
jgi:hypothetical protein